MMEKTTIILMRGTKILKEQEVILNDFKDTKTLYFDESNGMKRRSRFDYCKTIKRGMVFRESKINISSRLV